MVHGILSAACAWTRDRKLSAMRTRCDLSMIVLMVLMILDRYTFNTLHEWIGIVLVGLFVWHMALNAQWLKKLPFSRWNVRKAVRLIVALLLFAAFAAAAVTGILMSQTVFLPFYPEDWYVPLDWHIWHITSALWCLILSGIHLGMHWEMFGETLRRRCAGALGVSFSAKAWRTLAILLAACGVYGFFAREMVWYLTMQMTHLVFDENDTFLAMAMDYTCLAALAAWVTVCVRRAWAVLAALAHRQVNETGRAVIGSDPAPAATKTCVPGCGSATCQGRP